MNSEREAWIFLNDVPQLGPQRLHRLLEWAGSARALFDVSAEQLRQAEVSPELAQLWLRAFRDPGIRAATDGMLEDESRGLYRIVTEPDADYPAALRGLADRPMVLFVRGRWPLPDGPAIGVVGTRRATLYGLQMAKMLTMDLVRRGLLTISGMAMGIDTAAHRATLKEEGHTVAVLGHGLNRCFPRENEDLFAEIAVHGTLVTEFPYNTEPAKAFFPRRNRIISGLSNGVLVVEAGERSGALITARYAAEQGRDVFVVPGSVLSPASRGCHRLLKDGAQLVECGDDVWEAMRGAEGRGGPRRDGVRTPSADGEAEETVNLTGLEYRLLTLMQGQTVTVDEMAAAASAPIDQLANALLSLELKGKIRNLPGQRYAAIHS
ncbi:MAG TPA: DNA-processing protein DprA [Elusimicrobiota bacterium]|nr:DNA-processing protein DprA [Elusimicrobiota bacterium]